MLKNGKKIDSMKPTLTDKESLDVVDLIDEITNLSIYYDELNFDSKVLQRTVNGLMSIIHPYVNDYISHEKYSVLESIVTMQESWMHKLQTCLDKKDKITNKIKTLKRKRDALVAKARRK